MADIQRQILPIPDLPRPGPITYDAKDPDTSFPPLKELRPPEGAPNVLVIMLDDVGYGASSAFGGPCETPVFERLAGGGLKFTRFHTTALCSPTRQALLTGRNHHSVGMGGITEIATSAPGYNSLRPNTKAPIAETLRLNGYSTAQFGKCHEVPVWQTSPAGPFDAWPSGGGGFEHFYGFLGGETNQYDPALYDGTTPVDPPKTVEEGYHLTEDLTDRAIMWVRQQKTLMADKPFFCYFVPGACHAPHHVPAEWSDHYRGRFDQGWDAIREETLARQKELGVVPADAELTARHEEIPAWDETDPQLRPVLARQMEVYAGFMTHTDHHIGRLIDALEELGVLDDTLIYLIIGDNGASGEGGLRGTFNEMLVFNAMADVETPEFMAERIDKFGTPEAYNHYAVGWAHAMDTPYQWTKQIASHWGGTRNGTIVHWPRGITATGQQRHQFTHVIDIAPTILEAAGIPEPTSVNGVQQSLMEGTSMLYTFNDADAPERHDHQYFEMFGNRGIYHKGWSAVTKHRTPWLLGPGNILAFDDDVWELYDGATDSTQAHDLAAEMPDKLHYLQRLWLIDAARYNVLPLDDRTAERFNAELAGRPELITGDSQMLYAGMGRLTENSLVNVKNKSFSVTAEVASTNGGPLSGVILAQGGSFGGWSLYTKEGRAKFAYNLGALEVTSIEADRPLPSGEHQVRMEFDYEGGGLGKGGNVALYYDGEPVGQGRLEHTLPFIFSADETADVGLDSGTPVAPDYDSPTGTFTGDIHWVQVDVGSNDADHFIEPDERIRIAMARQ
ncbi:arylsulfatase [Streptomyces sp. RKAG293]|uniref:arylsulfatase n=1 Tax=Streptomyces sp. RKAG293 TaxID=2893403 RepID=UPI002033AD04|nr:arylsulfatase [Streptomyces sp. RKAG293]MCM2416710.1 arylsulfatase [Streptomyces sp. RKAG293]